MERFAKRNEIKFLTQINFQKFLIQFLEKKITLKYLQIYLFI